MPFPPGEPPDDSTIAIKIWNLTGGKYWQALEMLCEMYGVCDVDRLIHQLAVIRDNQK